MARILIVDDEPSVCTLLSRYLGNNGYECITTADSYEAWALLHTVPFDLVTQDLNRAGIDGQALCELVRSDEGLRDLPEAERGGARRAELASLTASIDYSFRHLPEADQRRLVILSLFEKVASAIILGTLKEPPDRFAGLDIEGWNALLTRLAGLGLLTGLGVTLYQLHPALPPFLAARWRQSAGEAFAGHPHRPRGLPRPGRRLRHAARGHDRGPGRRSSRSGPSRAGTGCRHPCGRVRSLQGILGD